MTDTIPVDWMRLSENEVLAGSVGAAHNWTPLFAKLQSVFVDDGGVTLSKDQIAYLNQFMPGWRLECRVIPDPDDPNVKYVGHVLIFETDADAETYRRRHGDAAR